MNIFIVQSKNEELKHYIRIPTLTIITEPISKCNCSTRQAYFIHSKAELL